MLNSTANALQASIDSTKRQYQVDIPSEIQRIKSNMDIKSNGYPRFWKNIHPEFKGNFNSDLRCPMNEVIQYRASRPRHNSHPIPNSEFFQRHELTESRRKCKRVENLIEKYSIKLLDYNVSEEKDYEDYLLLRSDFNQLLIDIKKTYISNNYLGLMSWLIDRALMITINVKRTACQMQSYLNKNRSLLLKVLYDVSPDQFLQCFTSKSVPYVETDDQKTQ